MSEAPGSTWYVYMLRCADGSLYTGVTKDVERRCRQHDGGTASRYTRSRRPVALVYQEAQASRSLALQREAAVKARLAAREGIAGPPGGVRWTAGRRRTARSRGWSCCGLFAGRPREESTGVREAGGDAPAGQYPM